MTPAPHEPAIDAAALRVMVARHVSRRDALRFGALGLGVLGLAPVLAACGGSSSTSTAAGGATLTPKAGGTLTIARAQDSVNFDKTMVFSNASIWVFNQIFETLTTSSADGTTVEPGLAKSWTQSSDKLTWTFTLRTDVKFSDGTPMTADDVKFSIDEASGTTGGWEFINSAIATTSAPDKATFVIVTKYPWAPMLADLACPSNGIIPKDHGGKTKDVFYTAPVGTGPFAWDTWNKGSKLTLKKNTNYHEQGRPYLDSVVWQVVPDDNTRNIMIQGGQAQVNENPPFSSLTQLKSASGVAVTLFPSTRTDYILMNQTKKPYDDVHVRRAISFAIDRVSLVKTVLFGNGTPANSLLMPTVPYYDKNTPGLSYDMTKAKAEMAMSTVPGGFSTTYLAASGDAADSAVAQILQASLKELGITMTIQNADPSAIHDLQNKLDYEISHSYWTMDIADPDELVQFAVIPDSGGKSFNTNYDSKPVQELAVKAQKTFDSAERQKLYSQLQDKTAQDAFLAPLYYQPFPYATTSNVGGFFVAPTGLYDLGKTFLA